MPKPPFVLSELEMRALVRQTLRQYIPHEGSSGPVVHALLDRIREYVGPDKYADFVAESKEPHHAQK